jgi:hypothetical protein
MSSYCNSIFFGSKDVTIEDMQPYMLTVSNKEKEIVEEPIVTVKTIELEKEEHTLPVQEKEPTISEPTEEVTVTDLVKPNEVTSTTIDLVKPNEVTSTTIDLVLPKQQDTLFWCIYIAVFGYNDYLEVSRNYGVKELDIKKQIADFLQKTPTAFKNSNIKVTKVAIQEILSELLTSQKETSILCLLAMIVKHKINVLLVDPTDRFYLEYYHDKDMDESPTYVLRKDTYGKYRIQLEPLSKDSIIHWKSSRFALDSYQKPLRAASLYKVQELEDMARRFSLYDDAKKYKKADLYNDICEGIRWR